jgi:quinoprotein glucose dehydrogenase
LLALIANAAGAEEVETTPLPVKAEPAFTKLRIARPVVLTHAGDGSNRVFVASQLGVVHSFANRQDAASTEVFLDIKERVVYKEAENEEGFLGMAFHPNFKQTGEVFVYYTTTDAPHTSVVSRFRLSPNNPRRADPDSEQELLRIKQPFWNHNGGTLAFGPDGYLYIGLGDGGKANDPLKAGQDLGNWLGSILRIDVDKRDEGKNYAIPPDNPFVKRKGAKPEIYAYGLRNIWRLSFDRQTGVCWAGDVGQDFWEEIDIIVKGGNYGWNLREGKHRFHNGSGPRADLIEPIWEYHHAIGKSITGCHVYRGKRVADLVGKYLYADYVSGKIWALHYDVANRRLLGNYSLRSDNLPVLTFGEDEQGEVYFTTQLGGGRIFRFSPIK